MMIRDKKTHKYYMNFMTEKELSILKLFLDSERERHIDHIVEIEDTTKWIDEKIKTINEGKNGQED